MFKVQSSPHTSLLLLALSLGLCLIGCDLTQDDDDDSSADDDDSSSDDDDATEPPTPGPKDCLELEGPRFRDEGGVVLRGAKNGAL